MGPLGLGLSQKKKKSFLLHVLNFLLFFPLAKYPLEKEEVVLNSGLYRISGIPTALEALDYFYINLLATDFFFKF